MGYAAEQPDDRRKVLRSISRSQLRMVLAAMAAVPAVAARGLREFVVGTGRLKANSQAREANTFGVLKPTLNAGSYGWRFVPVAGGTFFSDSGSTACH
jgi:hypothetical protein